MDFDEEMSSLQIEDLGEYFFPPELPNESWKGFSLGYTLDEDLGTTTANANNANAPSTTTTTGPTPTSTTTKPLAIPVPASRQLQQQMQQQHQSSHVGNPFHDPTLLVSPPLLSTSFSDMLRQSGGNLAALGFGAMDMSMSPALAPHSLSTPRAPPQSTAATASATNTTTTSMTMPMPGAMTTVAAATLAEALKLPPGMMLSKNTDELMDLANFSLEAKKPPISGVTSLAAAKPPMQRIALKPSVSTSSSSSISSLSSSKAPTTAAAADEDEDDVDDDDDEDKPPRATKRSATASFGSKRPFDMIESCSMDSCSTIAAPEDDRGFRKKSREKMRRQEVNVKFEELIELLGLSNRVRKSAILQEAVTAIKTLKRERDEMRRDRDRLQQEVSKLATCLQYSHLGSVAAANAMSISQPSTQFPHLNPQQSAAAAAAAAAAAQLSQLNPHAAAALSSVTNSLQNGSCFPIGGAFAAGLASSGAPSAPTSNATPIAPKIVKSPK